MVAIQSKSLNVVKDGLYWTQTPDMIYVSNDKRTEPGFKAWENAILFLLGGNTTRGFKMRPLLTIINPRTQEL